MYGQRRLVEGAEVAIEVGVFLGLDLRARLGPERRAVGQFGGLGAGLLDDRDWHRHVARIRPDDALDVVALGVVLGVVHQMQDDARAARRSVIQRGGLDRVGALAVGGPAPCLVAAGAARDHVDLVGDHERRVEADAELSDQGCAVAALVGLEPFHKGLCAGARDGAERLDHLVMTHADAVVLDGETLRVGVELDGDARFGIFAEQCRRGDRLVAQPFAGVRGVRNQFAKEHILVGIDRVHHEVQQA
jgi:hypothetical protein